MTDGKKIVLRRSGQDHDTLLAYYDEPVGEMRSVVHAMRSGQSWSVACGWVEAGSGEPLFVWTDGRPHSSLWTESWPESLSGEQLERLVRQMLYVHLSSLSLGQWPDQPKEAVRKAARATSVPSSAEPAGPTSERS